MPSDRFIRHIFARDDHTCQRRNSGCLVTATQVEMAYSIEELRAFRRDPGSSDNWLAVCEVCRRPEPLDAA